jgi:hypothetical protein
MFQIGKLADKDFKVATISKLKIKSKKNPNGNPRTEKI